MNNFSPEHFESIAKINLTSNIGVYFVLFGIVIQIFQFKTILLSSSPLSVKCYDIAYGFCCAIPNFLYISNSVLLRRCLCRNPVRAIFSQNGKSCTSNLKLANPQRPNNDNTTQRTLSCHFLPL